MTITITEILSLLKLSSILTSENEDEPLYIKISNAALVDAETMTYNTPEGSLVAIDFDKDGNIHGIEII